MITKSIAVGLGYRAEINHKTLKNADGTPVRARVNGTCKTWKTRPAEFRLPVKHGMFDCFYITTDNYQDWKVAR